VVSHDQANRRVYAPEKECIPWVDRWCPDNPDPAIPIISRVAYRECLRHLWLRGVDGMQIFQPRRPGYEDLVFTELIDAIAVYDEMLAWRRFLDDGVELNFTVPDPQDVGALWSGLRLEDTALIRTVVQAAEPAEVTVVAWPEMPVTLTATPAGETWLLTRAGDKVTAEKQAPSEPRPHLEELSAPAAAKEEQKADTPAAEK
jgi:hypothetical protein